MKTKILNYLTLVFLSISLTNCPTGGAGADFSGLLLLLGGGSSGSSTPTEPDRPAPGMALHQGSVKMESGETTDFGLEIANVTVGKTSTFQISNTGTTQFNLIGSPIVTIGGQNVSEFSVTQPSKTNLSPNENTSFIVSFRPNSVGVKNAFIEFQTSDEGIPKFRLNLRGEGSNPASRISILRGADIQAKNSTINMGSVQELLNGDPLLLTIKNTGSLDLTFDSPAVDSSNAQFSISQPSTTPLVPGATRNFSITFQPSSTGTKTAVISLQGLNDPSNPTFHFNVEGTGTPTPVPTIEITQNNVNYTAGGSLPTFGIIWPNSVSSTRTVTIRNTGSLQITGLNVSKSGANSSLFSISALSPPGTTIDPGASKTFGIAFEPTSEGAKVATVNITSANGSNGSASNSAISLEGTGHSGKDVLVSWTAVKEKDISAAGGGYNICYSQTSGFDPSLAGNGTVFCDALNWTSGTTPSSKVITVKNYGNWYIKVYSFTQHRSQGSEPSTQVSVNVPQ
ncbi:choice-of-anchor D domain-containing protein [Leptospira sp. GIMC2001]|uniref:choice-of-anchor D domain-containing protein n=1 Tax=Leptospira sp. GIMC2001 TaxID=1513297 RepID=UPI0023492FAA|nr:choice-of-anchor D domain-containing protein [Leptospira sp. GIMC2001]WCL48477.1 choice-of-anchor D domain-containing protein [Leptospira sp. GIMC2001]